MILKRGTEWTVKRGSKRAPHFHLELFDSVFDPFLHFSQFYHFTPVKMDELPPFKLCHPKYWEESLQRQSLFGDSKAPAMSNLELLKDTVTRLGKLGRK